jgi:hypothetical protein
VKGGGSSAAIRLLEYNTGKVKRNRPMGHVDNFADPQIAANATQQVGVDRGHMVLSHQELDHGSHGVPRSLHQIGA